MRVCVSVSSRVHRERKKQKNLASLMCCYRVRCVLQKKKKKSNLLMAASAGGNTHINSTNQPILLPLNQEPTHPTTSIRKIYSSVREGTFKSWLASPTHLLKSGIINCNIRTRSCRVFSESPYLLGNFNLQVSPASESDLRPRRMSVLFLFTLAYLC